MTIPGKPEALALAIVAVGGIDEKDLGKAAWPSFINRPCGGGEGEGMKTKGGLNNDGWPLLWVEQPPWVSFSLRPFASL